MIEEEMLDNKSVSSQSLPSDASPSKDSKSFGLGELQQDFLPTFKYYKACSATLGNFRWKNVSCSVGNKNILNKVTGHVASGELLAIMGLKDSGKTSLLNLLSGRTLPGKNRVMEGEFFLNEVQVDAQNVRRRVAYVTDEQTLYLTQSPEESLKFSFKLRFPITAKDNPEHVKDLISELLTGFDLHDVKDKPLRELDSFAKKRTQIAVELLGFPQVLFLEEPLEGFDSFEAWKILVILREFAATTGRSVITTIQQPTSEIFHEIENVTMLVQGEVLYNGKVSELAAVMGRLGHPIPTLTNPADYILLLAKGVAKDKLFFYNNDTEFISKDLIELEEGSQAHRSSAVSAPPTDHDFNKAQGWSSFQQELVALVCRDMKWTVRSDSFRGRNITVRIIVQLVIGFLFFQTLRRGDNYVMSSGMISIIFTSMLVFIVSLTLALNNYPADRTRFLLEYRKDTYSAISYFFSQSWIDFLGNFVAGTVSYLLLILFTGATGNIGYYIMIGTLISLQANALGMFVVSIVPDSSKAGNLGGLILVPMIFMSGLMVPMPSYMGWLQYISLVKFGVTNLVEEEFGSECGTTEELAELSDLLPNCTDDALIEEYNGSCTSLSEAVAFRSNCFQVYGQRGLQVENSHLWLFIEITAVFVFRLASLAFLVYRARKYTK